MSYVRIMSGARRPAATSSLLSWRLGVFCVSRCANAQRSSRLRSSFGYQAASLFQRSGIQYRARYFSARVPYESDPRVVPVVDMKFAAGYCFQSDRFAPLEIRDRPRSGRLCNQIPGVDLDLQFDTGNVDRRPPNGDLDRSNLRARDPQPGLRVDRASQPRDNLAQGKTLDRGIVNFRDDIPRFQSRLGRRRIVERPKNSRAAACRFDISADPGTIVDRPHSGPRAR